MNKIFIIVSVGIAVIALGIFLAVILTPRKIPCSCDGKRCDQYDLCGNSCNKCSQGELCQNGKCIVPTCQKKCDSKNCGDDGCNGSCGSCDSGHTCQQGVCVCNRQCANKECGPDGCGGTCGSCPLGETCGVDGKCVLPPPSCVKKCSGNCGGDDSCGGTCPSVVCANSWDYCNVASGKCQCASVKKSGECGDDGCGNSLGVCSGNSTCVSNKCICNRNCDNKCGGSDGCNGTCVPPDGYKAGTDGISCCKIGSCSALCPCNSGEVCQNGSCVKETPIDPCVGRCGGLGMDGKTSCNGRKCEFGTCGNNGVCCSPNCQGKCGGNDNCGNTCPNICSPGQICMPDNTCCTPKCWGKCGGSNGCNGTCPNTCKGLQWCDGSTCRT